MGLLTHLFYPWGLLLQAAAIIHFIRRRPDTYWLYIILFLGPIGAIVYMFAEVFPDAGLLNQSFKGISRRKRIAALELTIRDNPSAGNYEELGELCMDDGQLQRAREAFDKAIAARSNTLDCFYRRGVCAILLGDAHGSFAGPGEGGRQGAELRFQSRPGVAGPGIRAHGREGKGRGAFSARDGRFYLSETYLNFADLLASEGQATQKRANGRRKCWTRSRPCRAICGGGSGHGFGERGRC